MDLVTVQCPYCFESVQISLEEDVEGSLVQDCEVCCRPWQLTVRRRGRRLRVHVERAQ
jgi:hypothetical protein